MAEATIGTDGWDEVVTTTAETVFQNQSINPMYITTEATGSLSFDEGFLLPPSQALVLSAGVTVSAATYRNDGKLFYMAVE